MRIAVEEVGALVTATVESIIHSAQDGEWQPGLQRHH
jgi:hypothetical protein